MDTNPGNKEVLVLDAVKRDLVGISTRAVNHHTTPMRGENTINFVGGHRSRR